MTLKTIRLRPHQRARMKAFIEDPREWPRWPILPLKRRREGGQDPELGVVMERNIDRPLKLPIVVHCDASMLSSVADLEKARKETFNTVDELLDAGWEVD